MQNKIKYIFDTFEMIYDVKLSDFDISYDYNSESRIHIVRSEATNIFDNNIDINLNKITYKTWFNKNIPFILNKNNEEIFTETETQIRINLDIIGSAFYLLSGWDEFISNKKDNLGRHRYEDSIQYKLNIIETPVVNYYFDILKTAIEKAYKINLNYKFSKPALCLTHDVDSCLSAWTEARSYEIEQKNYLTSVKLIIKHIFGKDDWFNFDKIVELEERFNAKSSFFFLPQKGKVSNGYKNADYNISSKKIQNAIKKIIKQGNEVGIHSAFNTHTDSKKFEKDLQKFKEQPIGSRFHFLMYNNPNTIEVLEKNNIKYDSTLGYSEHIGFRNSLAFPFYIYNLQTDKQSSVLEIPLNIMDATFFYEKYMSLEKSQIIPKMEIIINEALKFNGVATVLWHNNYFSDYKFKGWKDIYIQLLEKAKEKNFILTNCKNILSRINQ